MKKLMTLIAVALAAASLSACHGPHHGDGDFGGAPPDQGQMGGPQGGPPPGGPGPGAEGGPH